MQADRRWALGEIVMSKVFVSHKDVDEALARRVAQRVRQNGLEAYLDSVDPALKRDGPDLADYLLERMSECEQLIAVVSTATSESWWVPWEIGVGSEKGFRMASYSERLVQLPSYLQKWPSLQSLNDVDVYCQFSAATEQRVRTTARAYLSEAARMSVQKQHAGEFHRLLKTALARTRR